MSPRPRDPKPRRNVGRGGRITWTVRYRLHGEATSRTFAHTSRDPNKPPRDALEFCADARDFDYPEADRRLEERKRADPGHHGPTLDDVFAEFIEWKRPRIRRRRQILPCEPGASRGEEILGENAHRIRHGHEHRDRYRPDLLNKVPPPGAVVDVRALLNLVVFQTFSRRHEENLISHSRF